MNKPNYYLPIFLVLIIFALLFKTCDNRSQFVAAYDAKAIGQILKKQLSDKETLTKIAQSQTDTVIKYRECWHKGKYDTILINVIALCDTVIKHDSILIVTQGEIIDKSDSIITNYQNLVRIDSCTIGQLTKDNKKLRRKVVFWKVVSAVSLGLNGVQVIKP